MSGQKRGLRGLAWGARWHKLCFAVPCPGPRRARESNWCMGDNVMSERSSRLLSVAGLAVLALLAGCASRSQTVSVAELRDMEAAPTDTRSAGAARVPGYQLRIGDRIEVSFVSVPEMNTATPVTPEGTVTVPVAGEFVAVGKTAGELAAEIEEVVSVSLLDPDTSVVLKEIADQPVFVLGEVLGPGRVSAAGGLTVSMAIAEAGGLRPAGKPSSVMVVRTRGVEEPVAIRVDITKVLDGRDLSEDLELRPNDVVFVPKSVIGKVGEFVDLFMNDIAPAQLFYLRGYEMADRKGDAWLY